MKHANRSCSQRLGLGLGLIMVPSLIIERVPSSYLEALNGTMVWLHSISHYSARYDLQMVL